ncbi:MAG: DNA internalization-related competence protein ComEC/Rec2 [Balneolaceae bacterium]
MDHWKHFFLPWHGFPAVRLLILFMAGILGAEMMESGSPVWFIPVVLLILFLWGFFECLPQYVAIRPPAWLSSLLYLFLVMGTAATAHMSTLDSENRVDELQEKLNLYAGEEALLRGRVVRCRLQPKGATLTVSVMSSTLGKKIWDEPWRARIIAGDEADLSGLCRGRPAEFLVEVARLNPPTNPYAFDYPGWLKRQRISLHGTLKTTLWLDSGYDPSFWGQLRESVRGRVESRFNDRVEPLALALLTGSRDRLSEQEAEAFSRAGIAHIMAVSGLHIGFILTPFWWLLKWSRRWKYGPVSLLVGLIPVLTLYCGIVSFSPSVCRASLMGWFWMMSGVVKRHADSANLMACSAIILLFIDTRQLFEPGFQLSYGAVFILLLSLPSIRRALPERLRSGWLGAAVTLVILTVIVQVGLGPLVGWYFGEISLAGPAVNLVTVPLLTVVLPFSLILLTLPGAADGIATWLNEPNELMMEWILTVAETTGRSDIAWTSVTIDSIWPFLFWTGGLFWIAVWDRPRLRSYGTGILVALTVVWMGFRMAKAHQLSRLEITVLDVGQGDAIHIKTPNNRQLLVDTGRWSPFGDTGERTLVPYFRAKGIDKLDALILTHPHADHIGGTPSLLKELPVKNIYWSGVSYNSDIAEGVMEQINEREVEHRTVSSGDRIDLDPSVRIYVLGPEDREPGSSPNDRSVVLKLVHYRVSILLTGDAEAEQERLLVDRYGRFLRSDLLKVGHHGSRTSSTTSFLRMVQPEKSVVSVGFYNRFGHPHREAVRRLNLNAGAVYYTGVSGALRFWSDGLRVEKEP